MMENKQSHKEENKNLDSLLAKDKDELEKIKSALDVHYYEQKIKSDKKRHRVETIRIIVVALMSTIISLGASYSLTFLENNFEKENRVILRAYELVNKFIESEGDKQVYYACKLKIIYENYKNYDELRLLEIEQYKEICQKNNDAEETSADIDSNAFKIDSTSKKKLSKAANEYDSLLNIINQTNDQSAETNVAKAKLKQLDTEIRSISDTNQYAKKVFEANKEYGEKQLELQEEISKIESEYKQHAKGKIKWFKEGYFLKFDDIRITLKALQADKNRMKIKVCFADSSNCDENIELNKEWINENESVLFSANNKEYELTLVKIARAGKNPFNKAAYVKLVQLGNN